MGNFKFKIERHIGVLSTKENGWTKEVNLVSWQDNRPKYDIREWSPDHTRKLKGITLTHEEAVQMRQILSKLLNK